ncbi:MAG: histidine--tRNA ligase [bacterium]|nr:histidine--tRNA ligase [bacterium]
MAITAVRGTKDVLPAETPLYNYIETIARQVFRLYGYTEIRTPIFEHTELFQRGAGEATDIVSKEMYTFPDRKGRSLTLRPEGTVGIVRAFLEHKLGMQTPLTKLFYLGPMFRYERPQAGRLRQHTQIGAECLGSLAPSLDAEVIAMFRQFVTALGLKKFTVLINSIGCKICRPAYRQVLRDYLKPHLETLCADCKIRYDRNPLRVMDCKVESCQPIVAKTPSSIEYLCDNCRAHFAQVKKYLEILKVEYQLAPRLVRGLDYYTRTVFECQVESLGAQNAIGGGGRYDELAEILGGPETPGLGFGTGIERLALALELQKVAIPIQDTPLVVFVTLGKPAFDYAIPLIANLRSAGIPIQIDYRQGSMKSQLNFANRLGAKRVIILGETELTAGTCILKDMTTSEQKTIPLSNLKSTLTNSK